MKFAIHLRRAWVDFLTAMQFLTRIPVPSLTYEADSLARSIVYFPIVGMIVGGGAAVLHLAIAPHLPRLASAFIILLFLVLLTGGLHEDGLADAADGFGGGTNREKVLLIMRDSRIGSYGGLAIALSAAGRIILMASLPMASVPYYLITAGVLCRWTVLPLSYFLPPAREEVSVELAGQASRIARHISTITLVLGTVFSFIIAAGLLRGRSIAPVLVTIMLTLLTGMYFKRRIGGVTGDCFGATIQVVEMSLYLCGAWMA